jgi:hypothetical protein
MRHFMILAAALAAAVLVGRGWHLSGRAQLTAIAGIVAAMFTAGQAAAVRKKAKRAKAPSHAYPYAARAGRRAGKR